MLTVVVFLSFLGSFLLYNTSKKAELSHSLFLEKWAQASPEAAKTAALLLLAVALAGSMVQWGTGVGIFSFLVILMTVASSIVLIAPLRYISYKTVTVIFLIGMVAELAFE